MIPGMRLREHKPINKITTGVTFTTIWWLHLPSEFKLTTKKQMKGNYPPAFYMLNFQLHIKFFSAAHQVSRLELTPFSTAQADSSQADGRVN
jgi:hypothetical protein